MKKLFFALIAIAMAAMCACTEWAGDPVTQTFSIDGEYTELYVEDAFDVIVSDSVDQVVVTVGENVMPNVVVKDSGKSLRIYLKGWRNNRGKDMTVILPYNANLTKVNLSGASGFKSDFALRGTKVEVELSGASDFYCDIEADEAELDLSGASDIKGHIDATTLELDLSGASDATLDGEVVTLDLDLSGSSTLVKKRVGDKYALVCDKCVGSLSGASDAYIHCEGSIKVDLSGSSELHYTGRASTSGCSTSGSSNVVHDIL